MLGGLPEGVAVLGERGVRGGNWDNYNSIINKYNLKKKIIIKYFFALGNLNSTVTVKRPSVINSNLTWYLRLSNKMTCRGLDHTEV